jgi:hypothetical protein
VEPFKCYGRYSKCEEDAKEDAAFVAMRWLLNLTGRKFVILIITMQGS